MQPATSESSQLYRHNINRRKFRFHAFKNCIIASLLFFGIGHSAAAYVCAAKIPGIELLVSSKIHMLTSGSMVIIGSYGIFTVNADLSDITMLEGPKTGRIIDSYPLGDGQWILDADNGFFRAHPERTTLGHVTGRDGRPLLREGGRALLPLGTDGWLLRATDGLYLLGAGAKSAQPVSGSALTSIDGVHRLRSGVWVIEAAPASGVNEPAPTITSVNRARRGAGPNRLFRLDTAAAKLQPISHSTGEFSVVSGAHGLLLTGYTPRTIDIEAVVAKDVAGDLQAYPRAHDLLEFGWLIDGAKGLFVVSETATSFPLAGASVGQISRVINIEDGKFLIAADNGLFVLNAPTRSLVPVEWAVNNEWQIVKIGKGQIFANSNNKTIILKNGFDPTKFDSYYNVNTKIRLDTIHSINNGVLSLRDNKLIYIDSNGNSIEVVNNSNQTIDPDGFLKIGEAEYLIGSKSDGVFVFSARDKALHFVPGRRLTMPDSSTILSDGSVILGAHWGVFKMYRDFSGARVELVVPNGPAKDAGRYLAWKIVHPCSAIADKLHLAARMSAANEEHFNATFHAFHHTPSSDQQHFLTLSPPNNNLERRIQILSMANGNSYRIGPIFPLKSSDSAHTETETARMFILPVVIIGAATLIYRIMFAARRRRYA